MWGINIENQEFYDIFANKYEFCWNIDYYRCRLLDVFLWLPVNSKNNKYCVWLMRWMTLMQKFNNSCILIKNWWFVDSGKKLVFTKWVLNVRYLCFSLFSSCVFFFFCLVFFFFFCVFVRFRVRGRLRLRLRLL